MNSTEIILHWLYVIVMFGSAIAFYILSNNPKGVPQYKYLIHIFVVVWSGLAYSALALDQGYAIVNEQKVHYARYIDWVVSTPLLLLSLTLTGKYNLKVEGTLTGALLGSQVIMILTGLVAELSPENVQYYWYAAGCIALVVVLYIFWGPLLEKARLQNEDIIRVYRYSAAYLTFQWIAYPVVWLIGQPGLGWLSPTVSVALFIILPIISKAGFGFFNLFLLRNMENTESKVAIDSFSLGAK
jgi:bacteriorhodopsin